LRAEAEDVQAQAQEVVNKAIAKVQVGRVVVQISNEDLLFLNLTFLMARLILLCCMQDTWETTADAEKPAIIAILSVVVVAQIAIGATM